MTRSKGDMASSRYLLALTATINFIAFAYAGPLGPLPNVTSADMGLKEEGCALGDVVYMPGDEFPGSSACERCKCRAGTVQCTQQQCEPRPGCKALHRPDHCCPTYQCECEQEGRVYGNGEKLVDPRDPCRVCYCQGGEVVCRRIACFVRDDCTPRLVPGRCCPEYDNCPLRGVTSLPGMTSAPSVYPVEQMEAVPSPPKEVKPEFTIKEITPVSEIPIITDVKIKEILPSSSVDVAEYSSSKSPLITREATSEKAVNAESTKTEFETPSVVEVHTSSETTSLEMTKPTDDSKTVEDAPPSKFSLSTQDPINSEIYPSKLPIIVTMGVPQVSSNAPEAVATTTKAPVIEEEDPSLFVDHNPAFPPLPDDLSVLSNHGDELTPETSADSDHIPIEHTPTPEVIVASVTPTTEAETKEPLTTTFKYLPEISEATTDKSSDFSMETSTAKLEITGNTDVPVVKENPMINLRSAIPTEIISAPSDDITRDTEEVSSTATAIATNGSPSNTMLSKKDAITVTSTTTEATTETSTTTAATTATSTTTAANEPFSTMTSSTTDVSELYSAVTAAPEAASISVEDIAIEYPTQSKKLDESVTEEQNVATKFERVSTEEASIPKTSQEFTTDEPEIPIEKVSFIDMSTSSDADTTTLKVTESTTTESSPTSSQEQTTSSIAKSNVATEVTSQTELSSLPIETSDQNPHEASENVSKDSLELSTGDPITTVDKFSPSNSEVITVSRANENGAINNIETTEFILTSFGSSESATDAVELIKIAGDSDKSAAIIDNPEGNKNALTDLIKLVSDVASISDDDSPATVHPFATTAASDSEDLIPVNAGYKSKNSNFNQNSITEMPSFKTKSGAPANKQKIIEIEDDEDGNITDQSPPNDKAEPTTRRPLIDNVSDDKTDIKTDKKDIEIITQSYVPTLNRRPTKVVLKEEKSQELPQEDAPVEAGTAGGGSSESATASVELGPAATASSELATAATTESAATTAGTPQ